MRGAKCDIILRLYTFSSAKIRKSLIRCRRWRNSSSSISFLQHSFRAWQFKVINIPLHRHLQCTCQRLENTLYLMMFVLSFGFYIKIHPGSITQGFEEVQEHFCRHVSYLLALELGIPYQPRASTKVKTHLAKAVVHRKGITIAFNAPLTA